MTRQNLPIGKIWGIPIGLDFSWFLIFALLTWMFGANYYPQQYKGWTTGLYWTMGAATAFMLFASVLIHELAHSLVSLKYKIPVQKITFFLFGGVAQNGAEAPSPQADFLIAVAGPAMSVVLALLFYVSQTLLISVPPLLALVQYLAYLNLALALFNLIPGYPLDGGRILRAVVWAYTGSLRRATVIAGNTGRVFAFLLIMIGVWQTFGGNFINGLWIVFIGWFLDSAASAEVHQAAYQNLLAGHRVSQAMGHQGDLISPDMKLKDLVETHILGGGQRAFLVGRGHDIAGLITLHRVKEIPQVEWESTRAADIMIPEEKLKRIESDAGLWTALEKMDRDGFNQLPVTDHAKVIGLLSRGDVISFLGTLQQMAV